MNIAEVQKEVFETACEKGWWDSPFRTIPECIALMHSELSEALEEYRENRDLAEIYYENGSPKGFGIEMADAIIRILDTCEAYKINLEDYLKIKIEYNKNRPYRHGGKRI